MNIKAFFLATLFGLTASPFYAQQPNNEWKETPNRVTLSGSLLTYGSDPGYDVTISYTRFLNRFLGITGDISFRSWYMDDYKPQWEVTDRNGKTYQLDNDESTLKKLIFQVGPVFRLPFLTFGRDKDMTISWECHPAAAFTFPNMTFSYLHKELDNGQWVQNERRVRNRGGQWNYWKLENSLCLQNDIVILSLGYAFSNQKPFSTFEDIRFDGKNISASIPSHKICHEFRASLGFYF